MRVLLGCSLGGSGHLLPLVGAARALERLGHETVVLVPPSLADRATEAGLEVVLGAQPPRDVIDTAWERVRRGPADEVVGLIDREVFAGSGADAMLAPAERLVEAFVPDLIVREPTEFATALVAYRSGIPQAQVAISQAQIEADVLRYVADVLDSRAPGLSDAIRTAPYLTRFPASLDPSPWCDTRRFREPRSEAPPLPDWWPGDDRPLILLTFGSVLPRLPGAAEIYRTAIDAIAGLPARVLVTLGRDDIEVGTAPDHVHIERWVPQDAVVAEARMVVCHGGSGTVFGALAAGVPLVVCPFLADNRANGRIVERAGAGRLFESGQAVTGGIGALTAEDVPQLRELAGRVLTGDRYLRVAQGIGAEMRGTPSLERVLGELLE